MTKNPYKIFWWTLECENPIEELEKNINMTYDLGYDLINSLEFHRKNATTVFFRGLFRFNKVRRCVDF